MSLVLAIDATQQTTELRSLVEKRLSAELVVSTSVGAGLLALGDRVPDLILTSPLLSPFDDGVLAEYLKELGPAGVHVQTLRIPVLRQAPPTSERLSLSFLRRRPAPAVTEGCDPAVFADEIACYLDRAIKTRARAAASQELTPAPAASAVAMAGDVPREREEAGARASFEEALSALRTGWAAQAGEAQDERSPSEPAGGPAPQASAAVIRA